MKIVIVVKDRRGCRNQHLSWRLGPVSEQSLNGPSRGEEYMLQLTDTQKVSIGVSAVDKKGARAPVENVTFESSDPTVATVDQDATDPSKAVVKAGLPGSAQIRVTADANMDPAQSATISGVLDVTVVSGQAVSFSVSAGTPEEQE